MNISLLHLFCFLALINLEIAGGEKTDLQKWVVKNYFEKKYDMALRAHRVLKPKSRPQKGPPAESQSPLGLWATRLKE